ncbi:hypothetical protein KAU11_07690 [Candidatus Babeliales bacterium]|nr:hypothetical protein [Candidatus Babeliales bacterium]
MRTIETLVRNYPNKTGNEILEIQTLEIKADLKEFNKNHADKLKYINDINTNGGYYKGSFGLNEYYYYNVSNLHMGSGNKVVMDADKIIIFTDPEMHIRRTHITNEYADRYGLDSLTRITKKEWDNLNKHLDNIVPRFWPELKIDY